MGYIAAIFISATLLFYLSPVARRIGLVDRPNTRKQHTNEVPLTGGIAIAVSLMLSLLLFDISLQPFRLLFFCLGVLMIVGVLDDHQDVPAFVKFAFQLFVAIVLVYLDERLVKFVGDIFFTGVDQGLNYLAVPFSILAIIGVINAFNMIDGIDGLAAVTSMLSLIALLIFLLQINPVPPELFIFILLSILLLAVFLLFNFSFFLGTKHQVFLGDSGSMFLGLTIVFLLIYLSQMERPVLRVLSTPWIIGLPLLDMMTVVCIRLIRGKSPIKADRTHLHHIMINIVGNKYLALLILTALHSFFISVGLLGAMFSWPDWVMFWSLWGVLSVVILSLLTLFRFFPRYAPLTDD